nr:MAG TPA: hypothetical protein [Caudoviricetes sp.]
MYDFPRFVILRLPDAGDDFLRLGTLHFADIVLILFAPGLCLHERTLRCVRVESFPCRRGIAPGNKCAAGNCIDLGTHDLQSGRERGVCLRIQLQFINDRCFQFCPHFFREIVQYRGELFSYGLNDLQLLIVCAAELRVFELQSFSPALCKECQRRRDERQNGCVCEERQDFVFEIVGKNKVLGFGRCPRIRYALGGRVFFACGGFARWGLRYLVRKYKKRTGKKNGGKCEDEHHGFQNGFHFSFSFVCLILFQSVISVRRKSSAICACIVSNAA